MHFSGYRTLRLERRFKKSAERHDTRRAESRPEIAGYPFCGTAKPAPTGAGLAWVLRAVGAAYPVPGAVLRDEVRTGARHRLRNPAPLQDAVLRAGCGSRIHVSRFHSHSAGPWEKRRSHRYEKRYCTATMPKPAASA